MHSVRLCNLPCMSRLSGIAKRIQTKQEAADKAARTAECTKEIDGIYATKNTNQAEYDKQLLTLSSGFLVLSLAFIKDIVHTDQAVHRGLLYASFIVLSVCVLLVLASFQVSNSSLDQAKEWYENRMAGDLATEFPYRAARLIDCFNIFSGIIFMVGIVLAVSFVIINLQREGINGRQDHPSSITTGCVAQGANHESSSASTNPATKPKEVVQTEKVDHE